MAQICFLICGYWDIHHWRNFNQNFVVQFKGVLHFDLQPHLGAGTLGQGPWGLESWCEYQPSGVTTVHIWMISDMWLLRYTVSHFSYAPPFFGKNAGIKNSLKKSLYLLIDLLSILWHTHAKKHESLMRIILLHLKHILEINAVQSVHLYVLFSFCTRHYPLGLLW